MRFLVFRTAQGDWRWTNWAGLEGFADTQREAFDAALDMLGLYFSMEPTA